MQDIKTNHPVQETRCGADSRSPRNFRYRAGSAPRRLKRDSRLLAPLLAMVLNRLDLIVERVHNSAVVGPSARSHGPPATPCTCCRAARTAQT